MTGGLASPPIPHPRGHWWVRILSVATAIWTYVTIVIGADVTASNASLSCPSWPTCNGNGLLPDTINSEVLAEFSHRLAALTLSILILALLALVLAYEPNRRAVRRLGALSMGLVVLQAALGGVIIFTQADPVVVILHLAVAILIFAVILVVALLVNFPHLPPRWRVSLFGEDDAFRAAGP
jgi:cytochrome c oxidase assembly protein subunit 15